VLAAPQLDRLLDRVAGLVRHHLGLEGRHERVVRGVDVEQRHANTHPRVHRSPSREDVEPGRPVVRPRVGEGAAGGRLVRRDQGDECVRRRRVRGDLGVLSAGPLRVSPAEKTCEPEA